MEVRTREESKVILRFLASATDRLNTGEDQLGGKKQVGLAE